MSLDIRRRIEVETVHEILDELDYYRILKLRAGAPIPEVERAFADQSQAFHPDRFFGVRDPKLVKKATEVFKKVSEAYQVLKDPDLKKLYDQKIGVRKSDGENPVHSAGHHAQLSRAALEQERAALNASEPVTDKRARKYWELAQIAETNRDWNGVVMNIQFAMNYEPENVILKAKVQEAKTRMREKNQKNKNPYKIKIV